MIEIERQQDVDRINEIIGREPASVIGGKSKKPNNNHNRNCEQSERKDSNYWVSSRT